MNPNTGQLIELEPGQSPPPGFEEVPPVLVASAAALLGWAKTTPNYGAPASTPASRAKRKRERQNRRRGRNQGRGR